MELNEKLFISGFNSGYLLAKFEPRLLSKLLRDIHPRNSYIQGMTSGQKEYELSISKPELDDLAKLRQNQRNKRSLERD